MIERGQLDTRLCMSVWGRSWCVLLTSASLGVVGHHIPVGSGQVVSANPTLYLSCLLGGSCQSLGEEKSSDLEAAHA